MVYLAISILVTKTAVDRYVRKQLTQGNRITKHQVYILVSLVTIYNLKTIKHGINTQHVKRSEIEKFVRLHKLTNKADTPQLMQLVELGYIAKHWTKHYIPTAAGKLEIKKIGLFVERLVKDYHCQPEKIPNKKKE